jgi:hypothetical protein
MADKWTDDQLTLLKSLYKDFTNEELIQQYFPNRTNRSLESIASKYNFSGKTEETMKRVNKIKGTKTAEKIRGIKRSKDTKEKISKNKKEYWKTHEVGEHLLHPTDETRRKMSKSKKAIGKWKGNSNPRHINPLNGEMNGKWKGGITDLYQELRSDTKDWQTNSMDFCKYKCIVTDKSFDEIHHLIPFKDIMKETFNILNLDMRKNMSKYKQDDVDSIKETLKILHISYGYGICLRKDIHKLFHDNYGYFNNTPYQFLDFVYRLDVGEFDKWLKENKLQLYINYQIIDYLESSLLLQQTA